MDNNSDKDRLMRILKKKFQTCMVYPLFEFEETFGELWGHGKPESDITDEQKRNRKLWADCRKKILDNGNRQIKNTNTELQMHDITWKKYTIVFTPRK